jgi:hypothetical protein
MQITAGPLFEQAPASQPTATKQVGFSGEEPQIYIMVKFYRKLEEGMSVTNLVSI